MLKAVGFDYDGVFSGNHGPENLETIKLLLRNDVRVFISADRNQDTSLFNNLYRDQLQNVPLVRSIEDGYMVLGLERNYREAPFVDKEIARNPAQVKKHLTSRISLYKDIRDYVHSVHGDKTFDDLYGDIAAKQSHLTKYVVKTSLRIAFEKATKGHPIKKYNLDKAIRKIIASSKDDFDMVRKHNQFMYSHGFDLRLRTNGHKSKSRIEQKARTRGIDTSELADLIRITAVGEYENIERFRNAIVSDQSHYASEWEMRASGLLHTSVRISVDGTVGQVMFGEEHQLLKAYPVSHDIYEVVRNYDDYKVTGNPATLKTVVEKYHGFREKFNAAANADYKGNESRDAVYCKQLTEVVGNFMTKHDIGFKFADITPATEPTAIGAAVRDLNNMHQFIHLAYLEKASPQWRALYRHKVDELNAESGREVINKKYLPSPKA